MLAVVPVASPTACTTSLSTPLAPYFDACRGRSTYSLRACSKTLSRTIRGSQFLDGVAQFSRAGRFTTEGPTLSPQTIQHSCHSIGRVRHVFTQSSEQQEARESIFQADPSYPHSSPRLFVPLQATTQLHDSEVLTRPLRRSSGDCFLSRRNFGNMPRNRSNTSPTANAHVAASGAAASSSDMDWSNLPPPPPLPPSMASSSARRGQDTLLRPNSKLPSIRFVPYHDHRSNRPSLAFPAVSRILPDPTSVIRVGRYSDRDSVADTPPNIPSDAPVGFKSKVVSRRHCDFFFKDSQWYIKDVKSSSGTFLNHIRLSQPGIESRPFPIKDGDIVQLGIDFKGGEEMIFRCVKILVFCSRGSQKEANNFNKSAHRKLQSLAKRATTKPGDAATNNSTDCTICLNGIAPCQSLFVAPCSHTWHYKCIRPLLEDPTHPSFRYPHFLCPNCRSIADLEDDVEEPISWQDDSDPEIEESVKKAIEKGEEGLPDEKIEDGVLGESSDLNSLPAIEAPSLSHAISTSKTTTKKTPPRAKISVPTFGPSKIATATATAATAAPQLTIEDSLFHHEDEAATSWLAEAEASNSRPHALALPSWGGNAVRLHSAVADMLETELGNSIPMHSNGQATQTSASLHPNLIGPEGPLTPRNNAGPFVFDGSASSIPDSIEHEIGTSSMTPAS